jgi:hypothetical protein
MFVARAGGQAIVLTITMTGSKGQIPSPRVSFGSGKKQKDSSETDLVNGQWIADRL